MAKQYVFNITINEKDGETTLKADQAISVDIKNEDLSNIASNMSSDNMSKFAEKYLNIKRNQWGYNYALLKHWKKYAGNNAKKVMFMILTLNIIVIEYRYLIKIYKSYTTFCSLMDLLFLKRIHN